MECDICGQNARGSAKLEPKRSRQTCASRGLLSGCACVDALLPLALRFGQSVRWRCTTHVKKKKYIAARVSFRVLRRRVEVERQLRVGAELRAL